MSAAPARALHRAAARPERDEWVAVTGTHVTGTGVKPPFEVVLAAESVEIVDEPLQTYE